MLAAINIWWAPIDFALKLIVGVIVFFFIIIGIEVLKNQAREAERQEDIKKHRKTDPFYGMSDDEVWELAEKGKVNAMYEFYRRNSSPEHIFKGFGWLVAAAEKGHPKACYLATIYYLDGGLRYEDGSFHPFDEYRLDDDIYLQFGSFGVYPSKAILISWLQNAVNHGIKVEQSLWDKVNHYDR